MGKEQLLELIIMKEQEVSKLYSLFAIAYEDYLKDSNAKTAREQYTRGVELSQALSRLDDLRREYSKFQ